MAVTKTAGIYHVLVKLKNCLGNEWYTNVHDDSQEMYTTKISIILQEIPRTIIEDKTDTLNHGSAIQSIH